jgi:hypothetical protein
MIVGMATLRTVLSRTTMNAAAIVTASTTHWPAWMRSGRRSLNRRVPCPYADTAPRFGRARVNFTLADLDAP